MKNIYVTTSPRNSAILFSKEMVKKYCKLYPKAKFEIVSDIDKAFCLAKPRNVTSPKVYAVKVGYVKGLFVKHEEFSKAITGFSKSMGKQCSNVYDGFKYIYGKAVPKSISERKSAPIEMIYTDGSYNHEKEILGIGYEIHSSKGLLSHSSFVKTRSEGAHV